MLVVGLVKVWLICTNIAIFFLITSISDEYFDGNSGLVCMNSTHAVALSKFIIKSLCKVALFFFENIILDI